MEESPDLVPIGLSPSPSTAGIRQRATGTNYPSSNTTIAKGLEESQQTQFADIAARIEKKLGNVDERLWNMEQGVAAINERLDGLEHKVGSLASEIRVLDTSVGELDNAVKRLDKGILVEILERLSRMVNNL
jgi:archaellum component FlaC